MITPLPQLSTPSPAPTIVSTITSIPALPDFSSLFGFDQRVSTLEKELSLFKQADHYAQLFKYVKSQLPTIVDDLLSIRIGYEFELKKILLDKIEKSKSYQAAPEYRELYDGLVKSYNLDKDLFSSYGKAYSLKRDHEDEDKDEDPPAGPNQGSRKRKTRKDAEPPRSSKSKDSQSNTEMPHNQGDDMGNAVDQPIVEAASKHDWFKKPEMPSTPNPDWNARNKLISDLLRLGSAKLLKQKSLLSLSTS
ncbi:hypothetical protein Tco_0445749 [Tanacetum coccineum]